MTRSGRARRRLLGAAAHGESDDGSSIVELVIVFPALLMLVMMSIEFGIWMHARHVAQAAAADGLARVQQLGGTQAGGQAEVTASLSRLAGSMFSGTPSVVATRDEVTGTASVTVDATTVSVVPFFTLTVHERVAGPLEKFVPAP